MTAPVERRPVPALAEAGPARQAGLSRRTGIHRSDMVAVLNGLGDADCVRRDPDPADRRRNVITLTATGRRLERLDALVREAQDELLDPAERAELTRLLTALADHHRPAHPGQDEQS